MLFWTDWHHTFSSFDAWTGGLVGAHVAAFELATSCLHAASIVRIVGAAAVIGVGVVVDEIALVPLHPLEIEIVFDFFGAAVVVVVVVLVYHAGDEFVVVNVVFAWVETFLGAFGIHRVAFFVLDDDSFGCSVFVGDCFVLCANETVGGDFIEVFALTGLSISEGNAGLFAFVITDGVASGSFFLGDFDKPWFSVAIHVAVKGVAYAFVYAWFDAAR